MSDRHSDQPRAEPCGGRPIAWGAERGGGAAGRAAARTELSGPARPGLTRPPRAARPRGRRRGPPAAPAPAALRGDRRPQRGALSKCRPRRGGARRSDAAASGEGRGGGGLGGGGPRRAAPPRPIPSHPAGCRGLSAEGKGGRRHPALCPTPSLSRPSRRGPGSPGRARRSAAGGRSRGRGAQAALRRGAGCEPRGPSVSAWVAFRSGKGRVTRYPSGKFSAGRGRRDFPPGRSPPASGGAALPGKGEGSGPLLVFRVNTGAESGAVTSPGSVPAPVAGWDRSVAPL